MKRSDQLSKLNTNSEWDVIIIGGGSSGLGAAVDAATRGYKTVLFEAHDFAKATSSRSTKLLHGGVRYLAQGDIALVKEALRERGLLERNASHLAKKQVFVIPNYKWIDGPFYTIGLKIYDMLSKKLSLGKSEHISKSKALEMLPTVEPNGLHGGVIYYDGQFDDSRMAVNLAQTAVENGGAILNYMKVTGLIKDDKNQITGVKVKDEINGTEYEVKGKVVLNATGVFTNDILNMNDPNHKKTVVPSQGIHLVLDKSFLPGDNALMIPKTSDGRVLFAVPWHNRLVVGTTDVLVDHPSLEPRALEQEIEFVLNTASQYLVKKPTRKDVLSIFAGQRPLAAPDKEGGSTKEVSRNHKILVSETGLLSIIGGKWTTFRQMAEDFIDKAIETGKIDRKPCKTVNLSIHGNMPANQVDRTNHLYVYGSDIPAIKKLQQENPEYAEKIHPNHDYTKAEIVWAVRQEMAQKVEDILARRVRLLFVDARAAIDAAESVAKIIANELGYDDNWVVKETKEFQDLAKGYLLVNY
ncbi:MULTISPECIES: glycerol-3-phosphate dehydrogenase/oxidase [unclassified Apibacter]|uniref:glycerol-3-phosphate dehydrogenase/oxidase n=1 Tax=unclassified Apibacter TaxID=2630820 RepID=UPI001326048A|nr:MULTISPECIES: glycerol-3-phosphate dehydrogenase/oxidase [unclassified Apibacter]MCX8677811.1 glycerol-3-phosphate dehydrogenase/oxidase [Apibacter sp. B3919]MXO25087.1 FAD-dependent oxidoreductase [Apibacter sp. B3924]MXO27162.1 FAD-dependent oxidoreductase [Apibacter sp. B3813]MXO28975.1 FAD-dependent oxidoreductase [Apibacter sp. B3913]MXO31244.1 FAD-dependent oxidoreductase [Apibacter sp. B3912]